MCPFDVAKEAYKPLRSYEGKGGGFLGEGFSVALLVLRCLKNDPQGQVGIGGTGCILGVVGI